MCSQPDWPRPSRQQGPVIGPVTDARVGVGGDRFSGGSGVGAEGYAGGSSAATLGDVSGVDSAVSFERVLSKGLRAGRVAAFAGGEAGAVLVSQEFGTCGASRGSTRHGITKVCLCFFYTVDFDDGMESSSVVFEVIFKTP